MRALRLRLLVLGAAATSLLGAAALTAQPPAGAPSAGAPSAGAPSAGTPRGGDHAGHGRRGGFGARGLLMRDITLSDAQKTQLRAVNERYRSQYQTLRQEARAKWQGRRPADGAARPDSATRAAFRAERAAFGARTRELRQKHLADVRAVLTPAQQASFDRNVAELRARGAERGPGRGWRGMTRPGAR